MFFGDLLQLGRIAAHKNGVRHQPRSVGKCDSTLRANCKNRSHKMLIQPHTPGDAIHDDANPSFFHRFSNEVSSVGEAAGCNRLTAIYSIVRVWIAAQANTKKAPEGAFFCIREERLLSNSRQFNFNLQGVPAARNIEHTYDNRFVFRKQCGSHEVGLTSDWRRISVFILFIISIPSKFFLIDHRSQFKTVRKLSEKALNVYTYLHAFISLVGG